MDGYNKSGYRFDFLNGTAEDDRGCIEHLHLRQLGRHPVHASLLEDNGFARSVEYALANSCPVKVSIEYGVVLSFSTARVAVMHNIDNADDAYVIGHRGDAEDGVFYVPKDSPDCENIIALLRYSRDDQRSFCFESAFNVVETPDGPFGRLEYTAIVFLDDDPDRQPV